jgi:hypothetical protein
MIDPPLISLVNFAQAAMRLAETIAGPDVDARDHRLESPRALYLARAQLSSCNREKAIETLYKILCYDVLNALVQNPTSGALVRLIGVDWRGATFWRDTIIRGSIRAQSGEDIAQYDGWRVWLEASAFNYRLNSMTTDNATATSRVADAEPMASSTSELTANMTIEARERPRRSKTKEQRVSKILAELDQQGRLREDMQPHEVHKIVRPLYLQQHSTDVPDVRTIRRAYQQYLTEHRPTK